MIHVTRSDQVVSSITASDKDAFEAKSPSENGLKRSLETEEAPDGDRSVKRKLSPEPAAE